jgi:ferredoxin
MLPKDGLRQFIARLLTTYRLIAPREQTGELRFDRMESPKDVILDYRNTPKPVKGIFFPQTEELIRFERQRDDFNRVEEVPLDTTPTILMGVRPCDARSFLLLDEIFMQGPYLDPYYVARRENTLVISLACTQPRRTCFCHAFDSGPYDRQGADVAMRDAGDAYLLEGVSARGAEFLAGLDMTPADEEHLQKAREIEAGARERLHAVEPVAGLEEHLADLFESDIWGESGEKCLACGTCTYVCPTCHCFNIEDRVLAQGGERLRTWDSCMYSTFTAQASGHNPRPDQGSRWRQRAMHKFEYLPRNVGRYGCVGCGRCIAACPVHVDIRQILERIRQTLEQERRSEQETP